MTALFARPPVSPRPLPTCPTTIGGQFNLATAFVAAETPTQAAQHVNVMREMVAGYGISATIPHYPDVNRKDEFMIVHRKTVDELKPHLQARFMQALNEYVRQPARTQLENFESQALNGVNFGAMKAAGLLTEESVSNFAEGFKVAMNEVERDMPGQIRFNGRFKWALGGLGVGMISLMVYFYGFLGADSGAMGTLLVVFGTMFGILGLDSARGQKDAAANMLRAQDLEESASTWLS